MSFVIDASMAAAWVLPDEQTEATDAVMSRLDGEPARASSLFWHEARSLLLTAERRNRLRPGEASAFMQRLWRLPIDDAGHGNDAAILTLAARSIARVAPMRAVAPLLSAAHAPARGDCRSRRCADHSADDEADRSRDDRPGRRAEYAIHQSFLRHRGGGRQTNDSQGKEKPTHRVSFRIAPKEQDGRASRDVRFARDALSGRSQCRLFRDGGVRTRGRRRPETSHAEG